MSNKDIFSFNPFVRDIDEQLDTPSSNTGIMSKDVPSTAGPMGEQMDDSYDPFSFVDRFSKDLVSLFDENEDDKEKLKNTYMVDTSLDRQAAKGSVLDQLVVDYNAAFERGRSLEETMSTIETLPLLPTNMEGVLQSPAPVSRRVKSAPASSPQPVLSAPAPQRRPRGLMEDDYGYTTLPQFRSGMTDPDSYEEGEGESSLFETIRAEVDNFNRDSERIKDIVSDIGGAEVDNFNRDLERIKDTLSYIGEALIPSAAAAEATDTPSKNELIDSVFRAEGGYSNDKGDTGNYYNGIFIGTNHGISAPVLANYLGRTPSVQDMKNLTQDEAREIAATNYYDRYSIELLPEETREIVFHAVYMGGSRGIRAVQNLTGQTPDGQIGPATRRAMRNATFTPDEFRDEFLRELEFGTKGYSGPSATWNRHGRGWTNRYNALAGD